MAKKTRKGKHTVAKKRTRYTTYNWVDHDPVIDAVMTAQKQAGLSDKEVEIASGVRAATPKAWRTGKVKRPFHETAAAVLNACGKKFVVVNK